MNWKKSALVAGGLAVLAVGSAIIAFRGTSKGIIHVSNVYELQNAIRTASDFDTIVVTKKGSPYVLSELPCMHTNGYLYVTNSITVRGESGNPNDVVIAGNDGFGITASTNRIFFVKAEGCRFENLTIANGICTTNTFQKYGGGLYWGAGMYLGLATNDCSISNCIFRSNEAQRGGAIACARSNDVSTVVKSCQFITNTAYEAGGAIYNGGLIADSSFSTNVCYKNGGAVYRGTLNNCTGSGNWAQTRGCELYDCSATAYRYGGKCGSDTASRFNDVLLDRCRLTITNGLLFSGWYEVRSSTITEGTNFALSVASPGKGDYEHLDPEESPTWIPAQIINCTIADNKNYALLGKGRIGYFSLGIYNTIFSYNTTRIQDGVWVNKNLATNGYYKTVEYTRGQQYVALGWDGEYNTEFWHGDTPEFDRNFKVQPSDYGLMYFDDTYKSLYVRTDSGYNDYTIKVSLSQYLHVFGWNGDTTLTNFTAKPPSAKSVKADTYGLHLSLAKEASSNLTWTAYYESLGWTGEGDYTHDLIERCDFDLKITNVFTEVKGTLFTVSDSQVPVTTHGGAWDGTRWVIGSIGMPLQYAYDIQAYDYLMYRKPNTPDPYQITQLSIAYHNNFPDTALDEVFGAPIITETFPWMETSTDLVGRPRLSGGGLDIGAYQAVEYRKPTRFIIRIR